MAVHTNNTPSGVNEPDLPRGLLRGFANAAPCPTPALTAETVALLDEQPARHDFSPTAIMARANVFAAQQVERAALWPATHDPRSAVEILDEIRREIVRGEPLLAADVPHGGAPLPSLPSAFSKRRDIFGPVETDAAEDLDLARELHARRQLEAALDQGTALLAALGLPPLRSMTRAMALLDAIDAPGEDMEPFLGAAEQASCVALSGRLWRYHGRHWVDRGGDQTRWGQGPTRDLEQQHDGAEPDADAEEDDPGEDGADAELTAWETHGQGFNGTNPDDTEDDGTAEPSLGAPERHPSFCGWWSVDRSPHVSQVRWADGSTSDREAEITDEPHDDQEDEPSIGWPEDYTAKLDDVLQADHDPEFDDADLERSFTDAGEADDPVWTASRSTREAAHV